MILVRHAYAGHKANWDRDDLLRPLTARGLLQAEALARSLADDDVSVIWSSAAVRCRQTVEPLAVARAVPVQDHPFLAKDGPGKELLAWIVANATLPWVLCTHGEVLHSLLENGRASGVITAPVRATEKGAAWRIRRGEGGTADLEYLPPLRLR